MNLTNFKFKQRLSSNSVNFIFKTAGELQWPSWTGMKHLTIYHQIRHLYLQQIVNNIVDYYGLLVTNIKYHSCRKGKYKQQQQFMQKKAMRMFFNIWLVFQIKSSSFHCSKQQQQQDGHHPVQPSANTGSGVSNTHEPRRCCTVHVPPPSPRLKPPWINIVPLATQLNHLIKNSSIVWGETPSPSVRPPFYCRTNWSVHREAGRE